MPRSPGTPKTGGRTAGTPNKATRALKAFLDRVFGKALKDPKLEAKLVVQITTLKIDPAFLRVLLAYWAGQPSKSIDHNHRGTVALERIIAGTAADAVEDEDIDE